jgi:osmotically-inducible protein OsmY
MKKGLFLGTFIIVICMLQACVSAVLVGAAAGGAVIHDSRSLQTMEEDTRISHELGQVITRDKAFKTSHVVISSFDHMLFLGGEVPHLRLKRQAEQIALRHPGVKRVYNEITIGPNNTFQQQAKDAWITTNVKTLMVAKQGLRSGTIKVITENGVVFLMGAVSHDQANLAVDVARRVQGVRRVVKIFKYTD